MKTETITRVVSASAAVGFGGIAVVRRNLLQPEWKIAAAVAAVCVAIFLISVLTHSDGGSDG